MSVELGSSLQGYTDTNGGSTTFPDLHPSPDATYLQVGEGSTERAPVVPAQRKEADRPDFNPAIAGSVALALEAPQAA